MADRPRHRLIRAGRDDRGSLVMAMLLVTVGMMLAGLLVPVIVTQAQNSRYDVRRNQSIDAAQAGIDIALGKIRGAVDTNGGGTLTGLPCTTDEAGGPITGSVAPNGGQRYSVTVHYFGQDPRGHIDGSDTWLGDNTREIKCARGGLLKAPNFAVIVSSGTATDTGDFADVPTRTVSATYTFQVLNSNVLGGQIKLNGSSFCLDAGTSPAVNTVPTLSYPCDQGDSGQLWAFNASNQVVLANTPDPSSGYRGLCMFAPYNASSNSTRANQTMLYLQTCANPADTTTAGKLALRKQQWGFQGFYPLDFIGTDSDGGQSDINSSGTGACWQPRSKSTGSYLWMNACSTDNSLSMIYDSLAGAGNASALVPNNSSKPTGFQNALGFLNNYGQFGRCLDDTYGDVPQNTYKYMIAYFCRSSPDPASYPTDAQLWTVPVVKPGQTRATSNIHLTYDVAPGGHAHDVDRRKYCLTTVSASVGSLPYLQPCKGSDSSPYFTQAWTMTGDTGDYGTSYTLSDYYGNCLQPDPTQLVPSNVLAGGVSKIIVGKCSSSTLQKWNAPAGATPSPIKDYHEK